MTTTISQPDSMTLADLLHAHTPVVFLDFDGVTHPEPTSGPFFVQLPRIEEVLRAYPQVPIVLSTSWREVYPLQELLAHFSPDISWRVRGTTPVMDWSLRLNHAVPLSKATRQAEVQAWLYEHLTMAQPWIAIDDRAHWFEPDCRHLVATDRSTVFTSEDADRLHQMLQERLP